MRETDFPDRNWRNLRYSDQIDDKEEGFLEGYESAVEENY